MDLNNAKELETYIRRNEINGLEEVIEKRRKVGSIAVLDRIKLFNNTLLLDEFGQAMINVGGNSYSGLGYYPDDDCICPQCGGKFTVDDVLHNKYVKRHIEYVQDSNNKDRYNEVKEFYHAKCNEYNRFQSQLDEFYAMVKSVYTEIKYTDFKAIPNKYCPCDKCAPWFIVNTPDGEIQLGWRKRVINLKWLDSYKPFSEKFSKEDVTKGFGVYGDNERYIHAWGEDKCIEYICDAKNSIPKESDENGK